MAVANEDLAAQRLPRLAFIADVNVAKAGGGSLLLHRLLHQYPVDRLTIVHGPDSSATSDKVLPGVSYQRFEYSVSRLIRNRFNPFWPLLQARAMRRHVGPVAALLANFRPEAVLTVPHWYLWLTAAGVARRLNIPLHLIVHDDWPSYTTFRRPGPVWESVRWMCRQTMAPIYRQAVSRLCVSPGMMEHCRRWYGADGTVLYPSLGEDSPKPVVRVRPTRDEPPIVAFCGTIHQDGAAELLRLLASVLATIGGHLDMYSAYTKDQLSMIWGLGPPVVRAVGFLPPAEMGERIGRTAHALFLPASFEARERDDVSTLFPSKLADYTAIGLPVLVWGPEYSSAARWAAENPGAAVCLTSPDPGPVRAAVVRLATDPPYAAAIAAAAAEAGRRYFDLHSVRNLLWAALRSPAQRCNAN